jgi:magnesium transporter
MWLAILRARSSIMLVAYKITDKGFEPRAVENGVIPQDVTWIDLSQPTPAEDRVTESFIGASIPTREESQEIEYSSRFYAEDGAVFMTASLLTGVDRGEPRLMPFTIIVAAERIATVRYADFHAMTQFMARAGKPIGGGVSAPALFMSLIESIVDRSADVLERISAVVDRINREIFTSGKENRRRDRELAAIISEIGVQGDLAAKVRESLASLERLVQYAGLSLPAAYAKGNNKARLKLVGRDVRSLEDHVTFLSSKVNFLLDASLGLISVEQNEVIRVLTVAATVFFPPTLLGTLWGMNFDFMPELSWPIGYPLAIAAMLLSMVLPYLFFRRRGWL